MGQGAGLLIRVSYPPSNQSCRAWNSEQLQYLFFIPQMGCQEDIPKKKVDEILSIPSWFFTSLSGFVTEIEGCNDQTKKENPQKKNNFPRRI